MNRQEFLQQLETELASVPNDERVAALQYFTMYFDDAGVEHEQEVISELGDPQKIAKDIKSSAGYDFSESWTPPVTEPVHQPIATESAPINEPPVNSTSKPSPFSYPPAPAAPLPPNSAYSSASYSGSAYNDNSSKEKTDNTTLKIILLIVLSPIWISLLGIALGLFVAAVVVLAIPFILGIAFLFSGIAIFIVAISLFAFSLGNSLISIGIGLVLLGAGILLMWAGVLLLKKLIPACIKGVSSLFYLIFPKKGVA